MTSTPLATARSRTVVARSSYFPGPIGISPPHSRSRKGSLCTHRADIERIRTVSRECRAAGFRPPHLVVEPFATTPMEAIGPTPQHLGVRHSRQEGYVP